jgi:hypothetical protein
MGGMDELDNMDKKRVFGQLRSRWLKAAYSLGKQVAGNPSSHLRLANRF